MSALIQRSSLIAIVAALYFSPAADAATPTVTAALNNSSVIVGQSVQMQIRVTGSGQAVVPRDISVDGLEIHQTETSRQVEMNNLNISQNVTYGYVILPLKSGNFRIPPQTVKVGQNSFQTPELQLTVANGAAPNSTNRSQPSSGSGQTPTSKLAFSEVIVTKPLAYVGEIIPVEIRLGFNARIPHQLLAEPEISGQGFTIQKLQPPDQSQRENNGGVIYEIYRFKTAIAATRTGKLAVGPAEAPAVVVVPRERGSRPQLQSPFDQLNLDDIFKDPFFADAFAAQGEQRKITVKSVPVNMEVKPLPANAPASFSGAIGNFSLHVEANPKSVQVGDPITVTATVSGRGNFDRVSAPVLPDSRGWHSYPPSSKFKQDDDVGISGTKTFEIVLSPNERKDSIPPLEFTYFDPLSEKYVSLKSSAIPVHVEGEALPATTAPSSSVKSSPPAPAMAPSATPQISASPGEILSQLDERRLGPAPFAPLFMTRNFWLAQILPLAGLIACLVWLINKARRGNVLARRTAALEREADQLRRKLRRSHARPAEFYADASRAIQIRSALRTNTDPERIDAAAATRALGANENAQAQIQKIFERRDELRYSGSANGSASLPPEEREQLIAFVDELR